MIPYKHLSILLSVALMASMCLSQDSRDTEVAEKLTPSWGKIFPVFEVPFTDGEFTDDGEKSSPEPSKEDEPVKSQNRKQNSGLQCFFNFVSCF
ncbi:hypothetical protein KQX54_008153 [Cotesia glomerata]|uniref:Uncharacterized protein n=1 Tax=Cotesia glomerata TaxID=32391 RepID=A0AAV7HRU0_COTGL|nr:hypothetical protein KQX54_008153 [Cotesia glomerata]